MGINDGIGPGSGKGNHPNSKRNLKKVAKGQVLNPEGARAHNKERKAFKKALKEIVPEVIQKIIQADQSKLDDLAKGSVLEASFARALHKDMKNGSLDSIKYMLERALGKPVESIDHTTAGKAIQNTTPTVTFVKAEKK